MAHFINSLWLILKVFCVSREESQKIYVVKLVFKFYFMILEVKSFRRELGLSSISSNATLYKLPE